MKTPIFELAGVSYLYHGTVTALDGIDLTVREGESLAVLGANGCGKSTLLRLMDGLLFPSSGEIRAFGEALDEDRLEAAAFRPLFRSRVGLLFQNPDVQLFCPTVSDEIAFGPLQLDLPEGEARRRVDDLLAMLGIAHLRDRYPNQLSGGEKKRVAIASVLAMNPSVLLFDEPTDGLDPRTRHWFEELVVDLVRAGKTVVTATHDLPFAGRIASRAVVIAEDHTLAADGATEAVLADRKLLLSANLIHY